MGYKVISRDEIKEHEYNGVVIKSYTFDDDITKRLKEMEYPKDRIERFFN